MYKNKLILIGALTSKPYAFTARSWELKNVETIDLFDSICSNVRIDIRGSEIMRVLPLNNEFLNEEWISDKTRFAYDGLKRKRFINPMIKKNNLFVQSSWKEVFTTIENKINNEKFSNFVINTGNFTDLEHITMLDQFANKISNLSINTGLTESADLQKHYTVDNKLLTEKGKKIIILVGTNLRLENPILNIKLKKLSNTNSTLVAYIGSKYNYNIDFLHLGNNINVLNNIIKGKHPFSTTIQNFLKTNNVNKKINNTFINDVYVIFGNEFSQKRNASNYINTLEQANKSNINFKFSILPMFSGKINALELGLFNKNNNVKNSKKTLHYLLNNETTTNIKKGDFVIFQGHHNETLRTEFDVILPSLTWLEKSSLYMNCFGSIQKSQIILAPPVNVRSDWKITKLFSLILKLNTKLENIDDIHSRLNELSPNIMNSISQYNDLKSQNLNIELKNGYNKIIENNNMPFKSFISNYYQITSVEKNSKTMQQCFDLVNTKKNNFSRI